MTWASEMAALAPLVWYRMGESSGSLADSGSIGATATATNSPTYSETGATGDGDTAIRTPGNSWFTGSANLFAARSTMSLAFWIKGTGDYDGCISYGFPFNTDHWEVEINSGENVRLFGKIGNASFSLASSNADLQTDFVFVVFTYNNGSLNCYIDGSLDTSTATGTTAFSENSAADIFVGRNNTSLVDSTLDEVAFFSQELTSTEIADLYAATAGPTASSLPTSFAGFLSQASSSIPMRLLGPTQTGAASIPTQFRGLDSTHYSSNAAKWSVSVGMSGVNSARLVGRVVIDAEESKSGTARFSFLPAEGSVDPNTYEGQPVSISFIGLDSAGGSLYSAVRFTGISTRAQYEPDSGIMTVECTNDLQGQLENMTREQITSLIGGQWSEHIFDDGADGWQYARDRLSTIPSEIHVSPGGALVVSPWATSGGITFTDANRFENTLRLTRNSRRDLITRNTINLDFRFTRLRHRDLGVIFNYSLGFCGYLDGLGRLPQKATITAAASANAWTRTSEITFTEVPGAGTYCSGKNWVGGAEDFCLGAFWTAARRWAQTVTEQYALTVYSPDLEEAVGVQAVSESYGIEATYDATDYENIREFSGVPGNAVLSPETDDWQVDADQAEADGRTAMEAAQECALAKAKTEILGRARGNRVTVGAVYNPGLDLSSGCTISTPHFSASGKVYSYTETFDLDRGLPSMTVNVAISRHGGSGTGSNDALDAPSQPPQPQEDGHEPYYYLFVRNGGTISSAPESDDWDGWITNAYGPAQTHPNNLYTERFSIRMPEIEASARTAVEAQKEQEYQIEVPQDSLTMSY